jgi:hypothetical protein
MPFIPVPLGLEIAFKQQLGGKDITNVMHFAQESLRDAAALTDLAEAAAQAMADSFVEHMAPSWAVVGARVRQLNDDAGIQVEYTFPAPVVGTNNYAPLSNNAALVITKRTSLIGRSYRGRVYCAGVQPDDANRNLANTAWAAAMLQDWNEVIAALETPFNLVHSVLSRYNAGAPRSVGQLNPITSFGYRNRRVDTQRRRLPDPD